MATTVLASGNFNIWTNYGDTFNAVEYDIILDIFGSRKTLEVAVHGGAGSMLSATYDGATKSLINDSNQYYTCSFTYNKSARQVVLSISGDGTSSYIESSGNTKYYITLNSAPTVSFDTLPTLYAGKTASIKWTTSDAEGDTVYTTKLVRYYKASGASSYTSTTLISSQTTSKARVDTIPNSIGGSVYYVVTVKDAYDATASATSATKTIEKANSAPTTPGIPTPSGEIKGGETVNLTWTASTDVDGNLSGYQLEVSLDGGSWTQIYSGSTNSYSSYVVPFGTETIAFRVRAYDTNSAYSSYATSITYAVINFVPAILGYTTVSSVSKELTGVGYACIDGVWKDLVRSYVCVGNAWKSLNGGLDITFLPEGFTRLSYIQSTGTQYIDTGYVVDENDVLELQYEVTKAVNNGDNFLFGSRTQDDGYGLWCSLYGTSYRWYVRFGLNSSKQAESTEDQRSGVLQLSKGSFVVNGTQVVALNYTTMPLGTLTLFGRMSGDGTYRGGYMRCYGFKITRNSAVILDLIPVLDGNNVPCMYDKVHGEPLYNQGSDEFFYA